MSTRDRIPTEESAMMLGAIGTGAMPKAVFGLFECFSTFSAVIFNAVLGVYLLKGKFEKQKITDEKKQGELI